MPLSNRYRAAQNAQETGELAVKLITVTHSSLATPQRFVADREAIVHGGNTYQPLAFDLQFPDEEDEGIPVFRWVADNVDQTFARLLRSIGSVLDVEVREVLRATPDVVERGPFDVQLFQAEYDALTAGGTLGLDPVLDEPFSRLTITPSTYPAEF